MARIGGVDLPNEKRVEIGLTYIYGIGRVTSNKVLQATGINPDTRVKDLTEEQIGKIREYMDKNLLCEEITSHDNIKIYNPKIDLVKSLIDCNLAIELSDGIAFL